jgi:hypothetical protein
MSAVAKMRQAGFLPALSPAGGLLIEPASKLTPEQRAYIRAHKELLLEELRAECAPANDPPPPLVVVVDPLSGRIAELLALGWAPWNAKARAESEALPAWREKIEVRV